MAWDSYQFFKKFEEELHTSCGFRKTGLFVCGDAVTENALVANSQMLREVGIISEAIDKEEAKKIEPYLNVSIFSKIVYEPESGYADPSMTASAFAGAAKELRSDVLTNTQVQGVKKFSSEKGYEISTNHGNIRANKVIVAMGPWSKAFFATLGISVPIKPVRHPVAIFQRPAEYSGNRPLIFDFPREAYYKPEGKHFFYAGSLAAELDRQEIDPDNYNESVRLDEIRKVFGRCIHGCSHYGNGWSVPERIHRSLRYDAGSAADN